MGASELPRKYIEKRGYCKLTLGDEWEYNKETIVCHKGTETYPFIQEDFEEVCPHHKIFSKGFNSICFKMGSDLFDNEKIREQYENEKNNE